MHETGHRREKSESGDEGGSEDEQHDIRASGTSVGEGPFLGGADYLPQKKQAI